jgi:hypothetical protein
MRTAFGYFSRCVAVCQEHGFGRIEVANRSMVGFSRIYLNEFRQAREDGDAGSSGIDAHWLCFLSCCCKRSPTRKLDAEPQRVNSGEEIDAIQEGRPNSAGCILAQPKEEAFSWLMPFMPMGCRGKTAEGYPSLWY